MTKLASVALNPLAPLYRCCIVQLGTGFVNFSEHLHTHQSTEIVVICAKTSEVSKAMVLEKL